MTNQGLASSAIEYRDPRTLTPWEANPRKHNLPAIEASLTKFGFASPVILATDELGQEVIVAGHGRTQAAINLGIEQVPCIVADIPPDQFEAFAIADNRAQELSTWEGDNLEDMIASLRDDDPFLHDVLQLYEIASPLHEVKEEKDEAPDPAHDATVAGLEIEPYEHWDYVVVVARRTDDWQALCEKLGLERVHGPRGSVGLGRIIRAERLLEILGSVDD